MCLLFLKRGQLKFKIAITATFLAPDSKAESESKSKSLEKRPVSRRALN